MTETRENAPDLVLVPREPTEAMGVEGAHEFMRLTGTLSATTSVPVMIYRAMLAAAPASPVPAPAYGVKEALEPFAKIAEFFADEQEWRDHDTIRVAPLENLDEAQHIAVGDLRRACTVYDALSPAPVEEADAKAGAAALSIAGMVDEWYRARVGAEAPFFPAFPADLIQRRLDRFRATSPASTIPSEPEAKGEAGAGPVTPEDRAEQYIQAAIDRAPEPLRRLGEWLANKLDEDDWKTAERMLLAAAFHTEAGAGPVGEVSVELMQRIWANLFYDEEDAGFSYQGTLNDVVDWLAARGALPEPEAKGGGAGAGPVGEAVAWMSERARAVLKRAAGRADREHVGGGSLAAEFMEGVTLGQLRALAAHPVDEPGEVERAKAEAHNAHLAVKEERALVNAAETALAETRERLEKVEAEGHELRDPRVIQEIMSALALRAKHTKATRDEPHTRSVTALVDKFARTALSTQESSAALAGNGKEAAR